MILSLIFEFCISALQKFGYGRRLIHMIKVVLTNTKSKIKLNGVLSDPFTLMQGFCQECPLSMCYKLLQLRYLSISLIKTKGIRIGDHEIKKINFADDTTIFLRDVTCLNWRQIILKLYEVASTSKISFKSQAHGMEHTKLELINQDKCIGHNFPLKYSGLILVTLSSITQIGRK